MLNLVSKWMFGDNLLNTIERLRGNNYYDEDEDEAEDEIVTAYIDSKGYHVDYTRRESV